MSTMAFAGFVKDVEAVRSFARELNGSRRAEYIESRKRLETVKERVFLAQTPMGAMLMTYVDALNAGFRMAQVAASTNAFDKFLMESIAKMAGADVRALPPGPSSHLAFEWTNGKPGKACTMTAAPVPDATKFWKLCRDMSARYAEHRESRERYGMTLERSFYLHDAKMAVVYMEGDDPRAAMEKGVTSTASYDKWFIEQISAVHGIDFGAQPPPAPELLSSYDR